MILGKFLRPLVLAAGVAAGVLFAGPSEAKAHPPGWGYGRPYYGGYGGYARPYYGGGFASPYYGGFSRGYYGGGFVSPYYGGYYQPRGFSMSVFPGAGLSFGYSSGGFVSPGWGWGW